MRPINLCISIILASFLSSPLLTARTNCMVVADSITQAPLPGSTIFDRNGNVIGICNRSGQTPYISPDAYPITIRILGYKETTANAPQADTIYLQESLTQLPEVVVESKNHKVMHMLAYVREYSTMSTYTDTVFLFREKMVDYMLNPDNKSSFKGWTRPRIIKTKSYYRFTNIHGLDSVSDTSNNHFSWSDWIGPGMSVRIPRAMTATDVSTDTVSGKYGIAEIWIKNNERLTVDVDVLADRSSRRWVPDLAAFFRKELEFDYFKIRFNYDNIFTDSLSPMDLTGYSYNIESNGRGRDMFRFNRKDEPFFVNTYAEVYILDKEYITIKEAKKWQRQNFDSQEIEIYEPSEAPELQPAIHQLVERVNNIDKQQVRLAVAPDHRIGYRNGVNRNFHFGNRVLLLLKQLTGISSYKLHKNIDRKWNELNDQRRIDAPG